MQQKVKINSRLFLVLLIIIISGQILFGQPGSQMFPRKQLDSLRFIAHYYLYFQEDSIDNQHIKVEPMVLLIGENISLFKSYNLLLTDSIFKTMKSDEDMLLFFRDASLQPPNPQIHYRIYKNYPNDSITYAETTIAGSYKYYKPMNIFNWKLLEDKKKWQKYNLQKATTEYGGRKWEAWFAPDIPINEGPYKFFGLPGLIIKVSDTDNHYVFELLRVDSSPANGSIEWPLDVNYIRTDKKGFMKANQNIREDIMSRGRDVGINDPGMLKRAAERLYRRNNPIELTYE